MTPSPPHRTLSRPLVLTLGCLAGAAVVGLVATVGALLRIGGPWGAVTPGLVAGGLLVIAATVVNLLLRFVRWHFLLRRLGVRLPTVPSLGAFVGSYAFLPVPLYAGQLFARLRLLDLESRHQAQAILAFSWELALNAWALAVLAIPALSPGPRAVVFVLVLAPLLGPVRRRLAAGIDAVAAQGARVFVAAEGAPTSSARARAASVPVLAVAAALSLAAWATVALSLPLLAWCAGASMGVIAGSAAAARAILLGAASLVPLGAGVSGIALLHSLERLGAPATVAADMVVTHRLGTVWFSLALGAVAVVALRRQRRHGHVHDHFDSIDACYDAWLPEHYRSHLVDRKTGPIVARLAPLGAAPRGLDIGCGRGWYLTRLVQAGARMTGLDMSQRQLAAARGTLGAALPLVQGSALALPFASGSFDFAYVINVLHHVATPPEQRLAIAEIGRVVRPGGLVFVHEMSIRNPLFRFYLGYVFPLAKGIEEGTEHYLDPRSMGDVPGLRLVAVEHFTFIPDFVPPAVLPALTRLERRLESSPLAGWAAHFVAVYERMADGRISPSSRV